MDESLGGTSQHCEPADPQKPLTLSEVLSIALCNHPSVRQSFLAIAQAKASLGSTRGQFLPQISAGASADQSLSVANTGSSSAKSSSVSASATLLLYDFGRREIAIDRGKLAVLIAQHTYDTTVQTLINDNIEAFYQLLQAENALEALRLTEETAQRTLALAESRYQLGLAPKVDIYQAQSSQINASFEREQGASTVSTNRAALAAQMGLNPDYEIHVREESTKVTLSSQIEGAIRQLIEVAEQNRPEIAGTARELESTRMALRSARLQRLPSISASTSQAFGDIDVFNNRTARSQSIGLSLSVPLFTGFSQHYNERNAELAVAQQELELENTRRGIALEVVRAYNAYQTGFQGLAAAKARLASVTESQRVIFGRYREGLSTILDVLTANQQLAAAQRQMIDAQYNIRLTRTDLLRSLGKLSVESAAGEPVVLSGNTSP